MNPGRHLKWLWQQLRIGLAALELHRRIPRWFDALAAAFRRIPRYYHVPLVFVGSGFLLLIYSLVETPGAGRSAPSGPAVTGQTAGIFRWEKGEHNYLLYLPKTYPSRNSWPMIVYLHGASLRGNNIEMVKRYGPPRMLMQNDHFPFIVLSPQCPPKQGWRVQDWLIPLIDQIAAKYKVDRSRIYLTGMSLGGGGSWYWAAQHPEKFAAIAPLCGYGNPATAEKLRDVPIWTFHGEKDRAVAISVTEAMVNAVRIAGGTVKFTRFSDAGHDIVNRVYQNEALYQWFLQHRR